MTRLLLAGAAMMLVGATAAYAQSSTTAQANAAPAYSYGSTGAQPSTAGHEMTNLPANASPNDPAYSYFEPIHRGQASESEAANSSWQGPYNQLGHDSGY
jgi:hypothetical protein